MVKILSIDGGGIRGIIPAIVLNEIENRTKKPIAKLFDLIAGTSTGGILALGLTKPDHTSNPEHSAQSLVKLYEDYGPVIFYQSFLRKLSTMGSLLDEKYPSENIEKILMRYFKHTNLSESLTNVLITSYEIERRDTFFFKSMRAKRDKKRNFLMRDVARATSAAPTFFEPKKIATEDLAEYFALIDGGVFANNPAMCAYVEAKTMYPDEKDFLIVSLGTGELTKPIYHHIAKDWGIAEWARPMLNVVLDGISDAVDYQLKKLLPSKDGNRSYYRLQVQMDEGNDALDNTKPLYLRALKLYGESIIREQNDVINSLCEQLIK